MAGPWEEWALVGLSNWVSGAGAVSSDSLSVVGGGGGGGGGGVGWVVGGGGGGGGGGGSRVLYF